MSYSPSNPVSPLRKQERLQRILHRVVPGTELPVAAVLEVIATTCGITTKRGCEMYVEAMLRDHRLQRPRRGILVVMAPGK